MGWRLRINFSDGSSELVDEVFDTEEDAQDEFDSWLENWGSWSGNFGTCRRRLL